MNPVEYPPQSDRKTLGATHGFWVVLIIATLAGGAIRLYGLNDGSLWIDEVWTVRDANSIWEPERPTRYVGYIPTGLVLWACGLDSPTIKYPAVDTWRQAGLDLWHIRLGPCLIGIASIPLLGLVVRRGMNAATASIFMLLLAGAPWHLYWSQLGRYYPLKFLLLGVALVLYYRATRRADDKPNHRSMIGAFVCVYAAFLVHPPAIFIGVVFLIDWLAGLARRKAVPLGVAGWVAGTGTVVAVMMTLWLEKIFSQISYGNFVGKNPNLGQSAPLIIANAVYMITPALCVTAFAGWWILRYLKSDTPPHQEDESSAAQKPPAQLDVGLGTNGYWALAACSPILIIAAFAFMGKFAHARYTFESLFGFLILSSIVLQVIHARLTPRIGRVGAAMPIALVMVAGLIIIGQYHTTGHHLHRRWVDVFDYIHAQRQPNENLLSPRPEIAQYYLGDPSVKSLPGVRYDIDKFANGKPLWVVDLGGSAVSDYRWKYAQHADLKAVYPIHVWQPYSELHVYRYLPRPESVWRPEKEAAEAHLKVENKPSPTTNP